MDQVKIEKNQHGTQTATQAQAQAKADQAQAKADQAKAEKEGPEALAVYLAEKALADALAARQAKVQQDARKNLDLLIGQIKEACIASGIRGSVLINIKDESIELTQPDPVARKAKGGSSNKKSNSMTLKVNEILDKNSSLKDSEISKILLERGIVHSAGQIFGAANRWRHKHILGFGAK